MKIRFIKHTDGNVESITTFDAISMIADGHGTMIVSLSNGDGVEIRSEDWNKMEIDK